MIADLIEANVAAHPELEILLAGPPRCLAITATDLEAEVGLVIGEGECVVSGKRDPKAEVWVYSDSATLIEMPRAKLLGGLPSIADEVGRQIVWKMIKGDLRIKGIWRIGTLKRLQRLLSVE